jgi:hypothetical protein
MFCQDLQPLKPPLHAMISYVGEFEQTKYSNLEKWELITHDCKKCVLIRDVFD